jgi:uncharacterized protein
MLRRIFCGLALLAILALSPVTAQAQSFNCRAAFQPDEVLICQSPRLAALDERMSSLYFRLRNRLYGGARRALESEQAAWLRSRIGCGRDYGCIERHYRRRIAQLIDY